MAEIPRPSATSAPSVLTSLRWLVESVGERVLAYLMACPVSDVIKILDAALALTEPQLAVATEITHFHAQVNEQYNSVPARLAIGAALMQFDSSGRCTAGVTRQQVTGCEPAPPPTRDEFERLMVALAIEAFPAFLFSPDPDIPPQVHRHISPVEVTRLLLQHPHGKALQEAVLQDPKLRKAFSAGDERVGHFAEVYRNTGNSGGVQLRMLGEMVLKSAWQEPGDTLQPEAFAHAVLEKARLIRDVLSGATRTISARIGFTGVLLPDGVDFKIGPHSVRAATDRDRQVVPESLRGQLSGTDSSGVKTEINYDGDIVFEYRMPYRARTARTLNEELTEWPEDMLPPAELWQSVIRLRFSLMLAMERDTRAQLVQTWVLFDDPFGSAFSWNDPRQGNGIMPFQLSGDETAEWQHWYRLLDTKSVSRIELALRRVLRAIAERREPSDVLVDSVIAWENIFGTRDGEPTFRITMCIAKILEDTSEKRLALKAKLGKMYSLRSKIVHGSRDLERKEYQLCYDALDLTVRLVKVLVSERQEILELPDGGQRSAALLLSE